MCLQRKMYAPGMRPRVWRMAKRRSVWGRALELDLQVGPQLRKPTIGKPHLARRAMAEVRETTRLKRLLSHGLQEIIWCQMDVVVVACAVLLDVNACSGPCHPTTPYYLLLLYSTSIEDSRCWLHTANTLTYGYSKNTRPTREACEASTNIVLLLLIGLIR